MRFTFIAVSDTHGELIDLDYQKKVLQFVKDHKPKKRFHLGDWLDLRACRAGASQEDKASSLVNDIKSGLGFLKAYRPHVLMSGNHDHRLNVIAQSDRDSLEIDYARQLQKQIDKELKALKTKVYPYDVRHGWHEFAPGRLIGHGYASSIYAAKQHSLNFGSVIVGHVHSLDFHRLDNLAGDESWTIGCGCKIEQEYNRTHRRRLKHQVGFVYGVADDKTGDWQIWPVRRTRNGIWLDPKKII